MEEKKLKNAVLVYLVRNGDISFAQKKEKIGAGLLNGYGGEVNVGESPIAAAVRETREETDGVEISPESLVKVALLCFANTDANGVKTFCTIHVYFAYVWEGEPKETREMGLPIWFKKKELPTDRLMLADRTWMPLVALGSKLVVEASYGPHQQQLNGPVKCYFVDSFPGE